MRAFNQDAGKMTLCGQGRSCGWAMRPCLLGLLTVVAWMAVASAPARAQLGPETARVATLTGRVSLERAGELWVLAAGQTVNAGQVVVTGPDGYAQLALSDHSIIEVFSNSRLIFRANQFNWHELLDLYLGKVRLQIHKLTNGDPPYRVTTPTAVISIRGTVLDVDVSPTQETLVQVETGSVGVRHRLLPGKEVIVESGQSLQVVPNVPLAAAKITAPLLAIGRIVRAAADSLASIRQPGGRASGSPTSSPSGGGGAPTGAPPPVSGSDSGSNEAAPAPGQDSNSSAPPGDVTP